MITVLQESLEYNPQMTLTQAIVDWTVHQVLVPIHSKLDSALDDPSFLDRYRAAEGPKGKGCTTWTRAINGEGYGTIRGPEGILYAHRLAYQMRYGQLPVLALTEGGWKKVVIDHACHNRDLSCSGGTNCPHRACTRWDHLRLATVRTNTMGGRRYAR